MEESGMTMYLSPANRAFSANTNKADTFIDVKSTSFIVWQESTKSQTLQGESGICLVVDGHCSVRRKEETK